MVGSTSALEHAEVASRSAVVRRLIRDGQQNGRISDALARYILAELDQEAEGSSRARGGAAQTLLTTINRWCVVEVIAAEAAAQEQH